MSRPGCQTAPMASTGGDARSLSRLFDPIKQAELCSSVRNIFDTGSPALATVARAYGNTETESLLMLYIHDLSEYAGAKEKLSPRQTHELAAVILSEYGYLTVSEITYFFYLFKAGRFGRFYGAVDRLLIATALREFIEIRNTHLSRIQNEKMVRKQREDRQRARAESVTYEEYEELRWLFNMGYERND